MSNNNVSPDSESNPYIQAANVADAPDLDSAAPSLRNEEAQRLNRKALMFLAGIVALLLFAVFLLFGRSRNGVEQPARVEQRGEQPFVPQNVPTVAPPLPPPVAVQSLPPLPAFEPEPMVQPTATMQPVQPTGPSLMQRRMGDAATFGGGMDTPFAAAGNPYAAQLSAMQAGPGTPMMPGAASEQASAGQSGELELNSAAMATHLRKPDTLLLRGTYIRCVLETRVITDHAGFTSCIVTEPVYSVNGKRLLLPRGSKVSGTYGGGARGDRVAVIWDRITTPHGLDVTMSSPGVDNLGGAGHPGDLDNHWASRITSALLISMLADGFKYAAAEHGPRESEIGANGTIVSRPYESATARTMERLANEAISNAMGRGPTVTINQGTVLNIYVARDVDFSGVMPSR